MVRGGEASAYEALQLYKGKKVGAKKGYELLKRKSDALKVTIQGLLRGNTGAVW